MPYIDSANLECDGCGIRVNHSFWLWPDGWVRDGREKYFCPTCAPLDLVEPTGVMKLLTKKEWDDATSV